MIISLNNKKFDINNKDLIIITGNDDDDKYI